MCANIPKGKLLLASWGSQCCVFQICNTCLSSYWNLWLDCRLSHHGYSTVVIVLFWNYNGDAWDYWGLFSGKIRQKSPVCSL